MTDRKAQLPTLATPPRKQPKAAREQLDVQAWESGLLDLARAKFPAVVWWHGYRSIGDYFGSYCYICSAYIVTFSRRWPIPIVAKEQIHEHKNQHRAGALPAGVNRTNRKGTP